MDDMIARIVPLAVTYGTKIVGAILVYIIGKAIAKFLTGVSVKMMKKASLDETLVKFGGNAVQMTLTVLVALASLSTLGVETTSFMAIVASAGLAIGLALQGSLASFASGVLLIIFRPFKVGDLVEIGGDVGVVQSIEMFTTVLHTPDNKKLIVPNSAITSSTIKNYSGTEWLRMDLVFGIGYSDDILKAKKVFEEILVSHPKVLKDPAPFVGVTELADSSVNFAVRPHVNVADYWDVYFYVNEQVKLKLDANNISIPFPQRDVHLMTDKPIEMSKN